MSKFDPVILEAVRVIRCLETNVRENLIGTHLGARFFEYQASSLVTAIRGEDGFSLDVCKVEWVKAGAKQLTHFYTRDVGPYILVRAAVNDESFALVLSDREPIDRILRIVASIRKDKGQ